MNSKIYEYESLVYDAGETGGAYVVFPYDIRKEFGKGAGMKGKVLWWKVHRIKK